MYRISFIPIYTHTKKNRKSSSQQEEQRFLPRKTSSQQEEQRKALHDLAAVRLVKTATRQHDLRYLAPESS